METSPFKAGKKVLFVSSEIAPFAHSGGLGEVVGSLPPALKELGLKPTLVMPLYGEVDRAAYDLKPLNLELDLPLAGARHKAWIWTGQHRGCPLYLIGNDTFFDRPGLYGYSDSDYPDNHLRFIFFCRAVMALAAALNLRMDVVHAHDWQAALLPAYLKYRPDLAGPLAQAASVLTIHNLAYQGLFGRALFADTGLPMEMDNPRGMEYWGKISFLKAGLVCAHALTAVSPTYAREIQTPEQGMGLEGVLAERAGDLYGILNGADYKIWSPEADPFLPSVYSVQDLSGKKLCRRRLVEEFGLDPVPETGCVLGFVGRLTPQKGVDLILEALPLLLLDDVRLCLLGSGQPEMEQALSDLAVRYPGRVGVKLGFIDKLAHMIVAGSDLFLMPSLFEPCGLTQMYAMRYGTPPVVRATGGLKDTVEPFNPFSKEGNGFVFEPAKAKALVSCVREALWTKARPLFWQQLIQNAMTQDFSWRKSALAFAELYTRLTT
jgi:starch synthase